MQNDNEIKLRNLSEEMIDSYIDDCMKESGICTCARCRNDVLAYALNHFPPHYVVTDKGGLFVMVDAMSLQSRTDIITAIMQGIALVKERPRHSADQIQRGT